MYEDYHARPRDRDNRDRDRRSSPRRADSRDAGGDYRRSNSSKKDYHSHSRTLDYDDYDDDGHDRDGDRDRYYDRDRDRERGGDRGLGPSSKNVVLTGLPEDAKERDVLYGLDYVTRDRHMADDQVRVARLRYDGSGRRIAVVEFHRRADAEAFVERYHPEVSFPLEHSRGVDSEPLTFRVGYDRGEERERERERRDDEDWDCVRCGAINYPYRAVCYKCKADRPEDGYGQDFNAGPVLTGETDEDPQQLASQYIVVRNLEPSVTEQVLATGVMKLFLDASSDKSKEASTSTNKLKSTAPVSGTAGLGAKPGSLRRVFLMRGRRTNESWRYGFAEFATVDDAKAAVAKYRASTRFTIASKPVAVAFIHTGVFVPELDPESAAHPNFSFTPIYNPALRLKYWDERAYPNVLIVTTDPSPDTGSPDKSDEAAKNAQRGALVPKKVKKDKDPAAPTKIAMIPQMQMWAKKSAELHGVKQRPADAPTIEDEAPASVPTTIRREDVEPQPEGPLHPHPTDSYTSYADWDRLTCHLCGWEVPGQDRIDSQGYAHYRRSDILIDHEVRVHNHYEDSETRDKAAAKLASLGQQPRVISRRTPRLQSDPPPVYISYADFDQLRCHLCSRKFKHAQTIWRHEQESELHKRMLADSKNKERATAELKEKGKTPITMVPDSKLTAQQNRYRDRAFERRQAFRQPSRPQAAAAGKAEKRKEPAAPTEVEETPAKKSKGAGMLAKMGWTAGVGLGAEGTGRTEAIATEAYAPGVGLGAEGGKLGDANEEAARKTRGDFKAFVEKTKDRARERYERLEKDQT
ncbi:hypothetical protein OQA88_12061 [Cercophora sp. LCS_1]